jgi:transcriptional regulator with XRE-family HTH domain
MTTEFEFTKADQQVLDRQTEVLTFADALKAHRLCEEWTQEQAAQKLGITKQMLSAYETGKRIPTPKKAYEIAGVLGLVPEMAVLLAINDELKANQLPIQMQLVS